MSDHFIDAGDLAERWGVSRATALEYTRRRGFPAPLALSGATLRWTLSEVEAWEAARKADPVRRSRTRQSAAPKAVAPIVRAARTR